MHDSRTRILQLFGLASFAFAQPVLDLLRRNPEFLVAHDITGLSVAVFAMGLCLAFPLLLVGLEFAGRRWIRGVHAALVAVLVAMVAMPPIDRAILMPGPLVVVFSMMLGALATWLSMRHRAIRQMITATAIGGPVFLGIFLFDPAISRLMRPPTTPARVQTTASTATSVVLIIFDGLPTTSLMTVDRSIDALRFPNFAQLSRESIWYRNATTVSGSTLRSIPAILSGYLPPEKRNPTLGDYPDNLFTLFRGTHDFVISEPLTHLCPPELAGSSRASWRQMFVDTGLVYLRFLLPDDLDMGLPDVTENWADFTGVPDRLSRHARVQRFLDQINSSERPTLYFLHTVLPHEPRVFYPTGTLFSKSPSQIKGPNGIWADDWAVAQAYQRFLQQLGFVDTVLGRIFDKLKNAGLYEQSLVVVTADHGASFRTGEPHRIINDRNFPDILQVPLFVKRPHENDGGTTSDDNVLTLDILPTIADVTGLTVNWTTDGKSVFRNELREGKPYESEGRNLRWAAESDMDRRYESIRTLNNLLWPTSVARGDFSIGPHGELVDRPVSSFDIRESDQVQVRIDDVEKFDRVDPSSGYVPGELQGMVKYSNDSGYLESFLAIAVNDTLRAVTRARSRPMGGASWSAWSALIAEKSFRPGRNSIDIFQVRASGDRYFLARPGTLNDDDASFLDTELVLRQLPGIGIRGIRPPRMTADGTLARWTHGDVRVKVPLRSGERPTILRLAVGKSQPHRVHVRISVNQWVVLEEESPRGKWTRDIPIGHIPFRREEAEIRIDVGESMGQDDELQSKSRIQLLGAWLLTESQ